MIYMTENITFPHTTKTIVAMKYRSISDLQGTFSQDITLLLENHFANTHSVLFDAFMNPFKKFFPKYMSI